MLRCRGVGQKVPLTFLLSILSFVSVIAAPYGVVKFSNHVPGLLDAPVLAPDGTTRLEGETFSAQLYVGLTTNTLAPVGGWGRFGTGLKAGYLIDESYSALAYVWDSPPGQRLLGQLRVWDWRNNGYTYEAAQALGSAIGESEIFELTLGSSEAPAILAGLRSFRIRAPHYGTVDFRNSVPQLVDAPVLDTDGLPVEGEGFVAQMYARIATNQWTDPVPIGDPAFFGRGKTAGYWSLGTNSVLVLTNMAVGQTAEVQVFVWERSKGATFEQAVRVLSKCGMSKLFQVKTGGDSEPTVPAPPLLDLTSFQLGGPAPGLVDFRNVVPGLLDAKVGSAGPFSVAQLYAGRNVSDLEPVGLPAPITPWMGDWTPTGDGVIALPNLQAGEIALLQVRAWDSQAGSYYEQAAALAPSGTSAMFKVRTGGVGTPPSPPALLRGLQSFSMHDVRGLLIDFRNSIPGVLDTPVFGPDGTRLSGSNYVAQLYANLTFEFVPVGGAASFGSGAQAGYWQPGSNFLRIAEITAGCCINVQLRIWDTSYGDIYETATGGHRAVSRTIGFSRENLDPGGTTNGPAYDLSWLLLDSVGVVWEQEFSDPTIRVVVTDTCINNVSLFEPGTVSPLQGSNYVAQVFVAPLTNGVFIGKGIGEINPAMLVPVGPVVPVRGARIAFPVNSVISLPGFSPAQYIVVLVRVWDADKGQTYDDSARNGGIVGVSDYQTIQTPGTQQPQPVEAFIWCFSLGGRFRTVSAAPGLSLIGNPFAQGRYPYLRPILRTAPEGTTIYAFDASSQRYRVTGMSFGEWDTGDFLLPFGSAFFIDNRGSEPITFSFQGVEGEPPKFTRPLDGPMFVTVTCTGTTPCSWPGLLGSPPISGDTVFRFVNGHWMASIYDGESGWSPSNPDLLPGEAVFLKVMPR